MLKYDSLEQMRRRLDRTIITHEGEPTLIRGFRHKDPDRPASAATPVEDLVAEATKMGPQDRFITLAIPSTDPGWSVRPVKLGWVETGKGKSSYLSRLAVRRGSQGLTADSLRFSKPHEARYQMGRIMNDTSLTKNLRDCILGNYSSVEDIMESFNKELPEELFDIGLIVKPFSRRYALGWDEWSQIYLFGKQAQKIGSLAGSKFRLHPDFVYLKQELEEEGLELHA